MKVSLSMTRCAQFASPRTFPVASRVRQNRFGVRTKHIRVWRGGVGGVTGVSSMTCTAGVTPWAERCYAGVRSGFKMIGNSVACR